MKLKKKKLLGFAPCAQNYITRPCALCKYGKFHFISPFKFVSAWLNMLKCFLTSNGTGLLELNQVRQFERIKFHLNEYE